MAPQISPDPDMSIADSDFGETALRHSRTLTDLVKELGESILALGDAGGGKKITAEQEQLVAQRDKLDRQAEQAFADHQFAEELKAAATAFRSAAPTAETITYAWEAWQAAQVALREALNSDGPTADAVAAEKRTQQQYFQLQREREQAIATHEEAEQRAMANRRKKTESGVEDSKTPDARRREGTLDGAPGAPVPGKPGTPAPVGGTPPKAAPGTALASSGGQTPAQAKALSDLLSKQAGQPVALPPQQPQPQPQVAPAAAAPAAMAPGGQRAANGRKPFDGSDLDRALGPVAALAMGAPPVMSAASPAPLPAPTPTVTGTSHTGLTTGSDVSGRAEPARTAFSPATNLSAAHAEQAVGRQPATGTGAHGQPMGHGMMPMAPGLGGAGAGGAPKKDAEPITTYDSEQAELHGHQIVSEAVPGGTIAQRRDD
ncbi:MAG: hypothetical protein K0U78_06060 [Actinomycetia bacterium]|nr:hypothetical protein [Actinomycetes bacterium]